MMITVAYLLSFKKKMPVGLLEVGLESFTKINFLSMVLNNSMALKMQLLEPDPFVTKML
jgi:hypothetical protein